MNEGHLPSDKMIACRRTFQTIVRPGEALSAAAIQMLLMEFNTAVALAEDLEEEHRLLQSQIENLRVFTASRRLSPVSIPGSNVTVLMSRPTPSDGGSA